jgi:hypothetical protein
VSPYSRGLIEAIGFSLLLCWQFIFTTLPSYIPGIKDMKWFIEWRQAHLQTEWNCCCLCPRDLQEYFLPFGIQTFLAPSEERMKELLDDRDEQEKIVEESIKVGWWSWLLRLERSSHLKFLAALTFLALSFFIMVNTHTHTHTHAHTHTHTVSHRLELIFFACFCVRRRESRDTHACVNQSSYVSFFTS